MIRTLKEALDYVRRHGAVPITGAGQDPHDLAAIGFETINYRVAPQRYGK